MSYPFLSDMGVTNKTEHKYAMQTIIEDINENTNLDVDGELLETNQPNLGEINGIY
tara:strand:- start:355 stop:522 length:168 start_codon:yes stop_codon:yes gene_type:complete